MRTDIAKWVAMAAMLVEHYERVVVGDQWGWPTFVGRVAFPIFAAMCGYNAWHRSRDAWRFAGRLLLWGTVACVPYVMAFGHPGLNVLFTLALGVFVLALGRWFRFPAWCLLAVCVGCALLVPVHGTLIEYGQIGVAAVVCGAVLDRWWGWPLLALLVAAANCLAWEWRYVALSLCAVGGVVVLALLQLLPVVRCRVPRWMWYALYPVHLGVFAALAA